ncbi:hypothetical protein [Noviherbaspirillum sp. UKPF54]|uniref:hypothetical protein n=1 Tax=Noviherbaspirillum sp. UKPF54 TaxID=2601898 RepID=UPI00143DBACC|nr:hypothetical protein [Noviherbaspirillum sp. UKPF54]
MDQCGKSDMSFTIVLEPFFSLMRPLSCRGAKSGSNRVKSGLPAKLEAAVLPSNWPQVYLPLRNAAEI